MLKKIAREKTHNQIIEGKMILKAAICKNTLFSEHFLSMTVKQSNFRMTKLIFFEKKRNNIEHFL